MSTLQKENYESPEFDYVSLILSGQLLEESLPEWNDPNAGTWIP